MPILSGQDMMVNKQARIIPVDKPGLYRWYAKEDDFRLLISSQFLDGVKNGRDYAQELLNLKTNPTNTTNKQLAEIINPENGVTYYGIYFGRARDSLRKRIVLEHMNGFVSDPNPKQSSTLRKSVSALIFGPKAKANEDDITDFFGRLVVRFYPYGGSLATKNDRDNATKKIKKVEERGIAKYISPLNIESNRENVKICDSLGEFLDDLSILRKSITW